jgi:hypothetical protein
MFTIGKFPILFRFVDVPDVVSVCQSVVAMHATSGGTSLGTRDS